MTIAAPIEPLVFGPGLAAFKGILPFSNVRSSSTTCAFGNSMVVRAALHIQWVEDMGLDIFDVGKIGDSRNDLRKDPIMVVVVLHDLPNLGRWLEVV
jgi:hypothetical protein